MQLTSAELNPRVTTVPNPSIQINPNETVQQSSVNAQNVSHHIQQVFNQLTATRDSTQPQAVELSILNDKFLSRPLILTSQQPDGTVQNLVLNISPEPAQPQTTVICTNSGSGKTIIPKPTIEYEDNLYAGEEAEIEKEPSTVNIITEFHASMVKSKKQTNESENEDNQGKKVIFSTANFYNL